MEKTKIYKNNKILYDGYIENNKYNGYGILYFENGNINIEGIWKDGEIIKTYTKYYENGRILYKSYQNIDDTIIYDKENKIESNEMTDSIEIETEDNIDNYVDLLNEDINEMINNINNNDYYSSISDESSLTESLLDNSLNKKDNNTFMSSIRYMCKRLIDYLYSFF